VAAKDYRGEGVNDSENISSSLLRTQKAKTDKQQTASSFRKKEAHRKTRLPSLERKHDNRKQTGLAAVLWSNKLL